MKPARILRADRLPHSMNAGKEQRLAQFIRDYRSVAVNCRRAVFKAKLIDLEEHFGIVANEVPSPYTSQECSSCGYVDRRNRRSRSKFLCRSCGKQKHADVNGACTVKGRRSAGLGDRYLTKAAVLAGLVHRFCKRHPRSLGAAADPRLNNPYFRDWSAAARNALTTRGLVPCVQKQ
jgi:putative transposase